MKKNIYPLFIFIIPLILCPLKFSAQNKIPSLTNENREEIYMQISLQEAIETAFSHAPSALIARYNFLASYWSFRSFKAELLPSLNLRANLGQYSRSIEAVQDASTGEYHFLPTNRMDNNVTLSLDQTIALTGGTISVHSYFNRYDQFKTGNVDKGLTYNTRPINVTYYQPIFAYNRHKWNKIIEPKKYERAKRQYLQSMENIAITTSALYFNVLLAQEKYKMALVNLENSKVLYNMSVERFKLGSISQDELLQLELNTLNEEMSINQNKLDADMAMLTLCSFLGFNEFVRLELEVPNEIPDVNIEYVNVLEKSMTNTPFPLDNEISIYEAEKAVASAKGTGGLQMNLQAQFGLTQKAADLSSAYKDANEHTILGLGLTFPIIDWGMKKGQVQMAMSREEIIRTDVEQAIVQHKQDVFIKVVQFNNQKRQCENSMKADQIASRSFEIALERFRNGTISVFDLNTAQTKRDNATAKYITELKNYWDYYFNIRKMSLYDYVLNEDLSAEFDRLIEY